MRYRRLDIVNLISQAYRSIPKDVIVVSKTVEMELDGNTFDLGGLYLITDLCVSGVIQKSENLPFLLLNNKLENNAGYTQVAQLHLTGEGNQSFGVCASNHTNIFALADTMIVSGIPPYVFSGNKLSAYIVGYQIIF